MDDQPDGELNSTLHCMMCAHNRRKLGIKPAYSDPPPRVDLNGVMLCPNHDLGGPVEAYPAKILHAIGHE